MIRLLEEKDRQAVMAYVSEESSINLFLIGDIEAFGFEADFQQVWGQYDREGQLEGVLLRYNENHIPYWKGKDFNTEHFTRIIEATKGKIIISGKASIVKHFEGIFPNLKSRSMLFCELVEGANLDMTTQRAKRPIPKGTYSSVKMATIDDAQRVHDLLNHIGEFTGLGNTVERIQRKITNQTGRI
ncbi:MAG: hypothetical protein PF505_00040 [Vallitaleaceae bacterium]|jgi:predicted GNAT family acetyltransferase|nr:hypothetical protein [Vallitaleaceae bacterium]